MKSRGILLISLVLLGAGVSAQEDVATPNPDTGKRIITIDSSGGRQRSVNLRFGPIIFDHPEPEGIVSTVSNLTIYAHHAELQAPEGVLIAQAQGQREASFSDGVRVERGRLEARGPELVYSESTGLGLLSGGANIEISPREEGEDPVLITTEMVEFNVDTDQSISRGNVELVNGNQMAVAEELLFEENRNLGLLSSQEAQPVITRTDEDGSLLTITADEIRVLTDQKRLYASGNVTVVDGSITSTGNEVFFDDAESIAEVIGSPAVSVDDANGVRLESPRIKQDIAFDFVEAIDASVPSEFAVTDFALASENLE